MLEKVVELIHKWTECEVEFDEYLLSYIEKMQDIRISNEIEHFKGNSINASKLIEKIQKELENAF